MEKRGETKDKNWKDIPLPLRKLPGGTDHIDFDLTDKTASIVFRLPRRLWEEAQETLEEITTIIDFHVKTGEVATRPSITGEPRKIIKGSNISHVLHYILDPTIVKPSGFDEVIDILKMNVNPFGDKKLIPSSPSPKKEKQTSEPSPQPTHASAAAAAAAAAADDDADKRDGEKKPFVPDPDDFHLVYDLDDDDADKKEEEEENEKEKEEPNVLVKSAERPKRAVTSAKYREEYIQKIKG